MRIKPVTLGVKNESLAILLINEALRTFQEKKARPEQLFKRIHELHENTKLKFSRKSFYYNLTKKRPKGIKKKNIGNQHVEYILIESDRQQEIEKHSHNLGKFPSQTKFEKLDFNEKYDIISSGINSIYFEYLRHAFFYDIETSLNINCPKTSAHKKLEKHFRNGFKKTLKTSKELDPFITERYVKTLMQMLRIRD